MSFVSEVIKSFNDFRLKPYSIVDSLQKMKLNLNRLGRNAKNVEFVNDIDRFIPIIKDLSSLPQLSLSKTLTNAAEKQLDLFASSREVNRDQSESDVNKLVSTFAKGFKTIYMVINDADDSDSVLNRMIFSSFDKAKKNRKAFLDENVRFIGVANRNIEGDNVVVAIFSDSADEINTNTEYTNDELRQAFELFDVYQTGRLDIKEVIQSLKSFGYDVKNNCLFSILAELDTKENEKTGVDWDTFSRHVHSRVDDKKTQDGLKRIYNIFIDDPSTDNISLNLLRKICREIGEPIETPEFKDMVERAQNNNIELTLKEFQDYMNSK